MLAYAFASAQAAVQSAPEFVDSTIGILKHERDQLIPLVVEGPSHLRSLRLRQLKFIERQLVEIQSKRVKAPLQMHQ